MKRFQWLMALGAVWLLVAACGGSSSSGTARASGSTTSAGPAAPGGKVADKLVGENESASTWTCQFTPFNPAVTLVSFGWVYEPLEYVNILKTGSVTPWLGGGGGGGGGG